MTEEKNEGALTKDAFALGRACGPMPANACYGAMFSRPGVGGLMNSQSPG